MYVPHILEASGETRFSLEVYPPKAVPDPEDEMPLQRHLAAIFDTVEHLLPHDPAFVSVTSSPGGKTRTTSIPVAAMIRERFRVEPVVHLTCMATPVPRIPRVLEVLHYFEIQNILAVRGDAPDGSVDPLPRPRYASDLVREIRSRDPGFCIGVAGYPEGHPECRGPDNLPDLAADTDHFRTKIAEGASFAISQLFLDNHHFFDLVSRARARDIHIPILPGIMPLTDPETLGITTDLCRVTVPGSLMRRMDAAREDPGEMREIGIDHALRQCRGLMDRVPCIHFYTMDRWETVHRIIESLTR